MGTETGVLELTQYFQSGYLAIKKIFGDFVVYLIEINAFDRDFVKIRKGAITLIDVTSGASTQKLGLIDKYTFI